MWAAILLVLGTYIIQDGGVQKVYLDDKPTFIEVSAEFDNSWMPDIGQTPEHKAVIVVENQKIIMGGEYKKSQGDSYRCNIIFRYKFDKEKNYLEITHSHDIFSEDALLGVLKIMYDNKKLSIPLKTSKKPTYKLSANWKDFKSLTDEHDTFGYRDSSKHAFWIGYATNNRLDLPFNMQFPYQPIGKNQVIKVSFDYWNSGETINPTLFEVNEDTYNRFDFSLSSNVQSHTLKIYRNGMWHHFKHTFKTGNTNNISFRWKPKSLDDVGLEYNMTMIDNLKLEVLNQKDTP